MNAKIRVYTTRWCPDCRRAKHFLAEHGLGFEEVDIEEADGAAEFIIAANGGKRRVPTIEVNGRVFHCSPYDPDKLRRELGLS
jgi:mycoredoxin